MSKIPENNPRRKSRVCGEYPKALFRFFDKEEYADEFVQHGRFRISPLETYREIECEVRRDVSEGEGLYRMQGPVVSALISRDESIPPVWSEEDGIQVRHSHVAAPIFPFCCANTSADVDYLRTRFGQYVVKIESPVGLAIEIDRFLNGEDGGRGPYLVIGSNVEYNKGELITDGRAPDQLVDLAYTQKPEIFHQESEFRFCVIKLSPESGPLPPLEIDLGGGRYTYAKLI